MCVKSGYNFNNSVLQYFYLFSVQKIRVKHLRVMHFLTTGVHKSVTCGYNKDIDNLKVDSIRVQMLYCHNNSVIFKDILYYMCKKTG